jgi:hypothetical protein
MMNVGAETFDHPPLEVSDPLNCNAKFVSAEGHET